MRRMKHTDIISYGETINGIPVCARYTRESVEEILIPLLRRLSAMERKKRGRILVMLAAPPGAGKSTLAGFLQALSRSLAQKDPEIEPVTAIGMDGFHRYQADLLSHKTVRQGREISLVQIKGAPETFDLERLTSRIRQVAGGEACQWPEYSRLLHNPVENGVRVQGNVILLEGNYLLLDREGWRDLAGWADYTIRIRGEEAMLKKRLIQRKILSGTEPRAAEDFVEFSDMANVRECLAHTRKGDLNLVVDEDGFYHMEGL